MSKINILNSKVYNRISAGEVVERPSSVVKELVENAIDAGSKNIVIEITEGGIKQIKITDDGCGIMFEDLKKAFLPHATSKISQAEDLENILTLGFRGEALASISAVSQVTLISKYVDSELGGKITVNGGEIGSPVECGTKTGTTITIENLFFNTPARFKFLKSAKQEESAITNIVSRLMFANPDLAIKYIVNGKTMFSSILKGLKEKVYNVYGKDTIENIVNINTDNGSYKLSGFISKPTYCKANKTYQTLIVNGRYVSNALLSTAVQNAYENFMMRGKFPLFVLSITVPSDEIDVNVHPSKMEVKFNNSNKLFGFVYSSVLQTLNDSNFSTYFSNENLPLEQLQEETSKGVEVKPQLNEIKSGGFSFGDMQSFANKMKKISVEIPTFTRGDSVLKTTDNSHFEESNLDTNLSNSVPKDMDFNMFSTENLNKSAKILIQEELNKDIPFKLIGSIFNTYLAIEVENKFYLIDQHAGHERVLFDKFMSIFNEKKLISQPLLLPYVFDVNEVEKTLVQDNIAVFSSLGFDVEEFGKNSYKITSVPSILSNINLDEFLQDALKNENKVSNTNEQIKKHFATCACKAAVKGGQDLSEEEIKILLEEILSSNHTLLCPHGRPICVCLTKYEIEKMFKRIV